MLFFDLEAYAPPDERTASLGSLSFLFPEEPVLYPKTTREMAGRLGLRERKGSSKSVWDSYESGDYGAIEQRTEHELRLLLAIYARLRERVAGAARP